MAARFCGAQPDTIVAVTGTAGKTSVAHFVRQIFQAAGHPAASLGTLGTIKPAGESYGGLTTPDPVALHKELAELRVENINHAAMEASSHGLDQHRLDGVQLTAAAFTNLGRDHMDYHPTIEDYLKAKLRLFDELLPEGGTVVVDPDEKYADRVIEVAEQRGQQIFTVGESGKDLKLTGLKPSGAGQDLTLETERGEYKVTLPLIGRFQVSNALIAAGLAIAAGIDTGAVLRSLENLKGAPGRLELAGRTSEGGLVFVDYAHKPDALDNALAALKPFAEGTLSVVVGAGGDRDPGKRELMGEAAARHADLVIITDDNPRSEDPASIRKAVLKGAPGALEIGDRYEAIAEGVRRLKTGDILCVAGKGHETGQIVGDTVIPFSDHEAVTRAISLEGNT
ncbi:MAG: UDP-N-acetylmuramoyl-L-alanyl-D-glutamate--2,6-diaminopimelate ligase [Pseudomonadota bacterium]